ncbi:transglutaminase [Streptomyces sp. TRM43335]|uniref:Transglutaminase n=1 Tax=Streptomyces taklimakanensis TaxID=2569853 RepID=A0A6G2B9A9_9ACTN|nr:DUF3488 and transglutaminase-like domain-containing protein [Streptomyces taklimakanensis]MTE18653.1 transglutaminase [Streptomyces taklimakanensis]
MDGRVRLALCAWVATLAAAGSLLPLVAPSVWLLEAALLLGAQTLVGVAVRRASASRAATVGAQSSVTLLLLTFVFVRRDAVFGILPGPDALEAFGTLLAQGTADVGRFAIPAPVTDGIRLLLVGGVVLIGLLVDASAVTYRSAAPAGLPLLALYSVAAGLSPDGTRWTWFLCAAAGYLLLLLAEGRDRLSRWGWSFGPSGGPARPTAPGGPAPTPARGGRRIGVLALGIALVVPAALPSLGEGLLDTARGGGGTSGDGGTVSAVNPLVALQDSLNQPDNRTVLTYATDAESTADLYLRIVALDRFDGTSWRPSERRITDLPRPLPPVSGLSPSVETERITTSFRAAGWYAQNWLPMPYPAADVRIDGRWRFEPEGRALVGDRGQTTRGARYEVESLQVRPTIEQLTGAPDPPRQVLDEYTRVPDSLPEVVARTAREVTVNASGAYEQAVRLQEWFSADGGFRYDTRVKAGSGSAAIARFLEQREGFCVHFAFSMAAMARTLGIPARVAVGFTPGVSDGADGMVVGLQDAHAWPELYFEGVGWTRFEPTPSRGSVPDYTQPDLPAPDRPSVPEPLPTDGGTPEPEPSRSVECLAGHGEDCDGAAAPGGGPSGDESLAQRVLTAVTGALPAVLAALVLLALLALPLLWRRTVRARRMGEMSEPPSRGKPPGADGAAAVGGTVPEGAPGGPSGASGGPPEQDAGLRTLAAWREMTDSAWDYGVLPEESATPRTAAARVVRLGGLEGEAAKATHRLATALEHALYAAEARPARGLAEDVRRVRAGLRAAAGRRERLRALLLPRSSVRMLWSLSARRAALAGRWHGLAGRVRRTVARFRPSRQRA